MSKKTIRLLTLLGNSQTKSPDSPSQATLETFENAHFKQSYLIHIDCPDFTSLCPVTGQPDYACLQISYAPGKLCVETKSLKLYLSSYRNEPAFNEEIVNRVLKDLVATCRPQTMRVEGRFAPRGGIALTIVAHHPNRKFGVQDLSNGKASSQKTLRLNKDQPWEID